MAKLFRKNRTWYLAVSFKGKRIRRSLGTKDKRNAASLSKNVEMNILRELLGISKKPPRISRKILIKEFLDHNENWNRATKEWYEVSIRQYLNKCYNSSYNKAVNVLLNYAKHKGYEHDIPSPPNVKNYKPRIRTFSKEEMSLILNQTKPYQFKQFVRFAYHTGARSGEIRCMKKKDIIRSIVIGKSGVRTLKITKQALESLNIENLWDYKKEYVSHKFKHNIRSLGIKDGRFHDLRRTFGLNLIKQGFNIFEVSKLLGHSSVKTTELHYAPLLATDVEEFEL